MLVMPNPLKSTPVDLHRLSFALAEMRTDVQTSCKDSGCSEGLLTVKLVELISAGPQDTFRCPVKTSATSVMFPWNPSGVHWVLVVASVDPSGVKDPDSRL
jgi:hypothetical protein